MLEKLLEKIIFLTGAPKVTRGYNPLFTSIQRRGCKAFYDNRYEYKLLLYYQATIKINPPYLRKTDGGFLSILYRLELSHGGIFF